MHVTLYHDALIPPPKYGGTERIVYWLAKALVSLGHEVSLIAAPGSRIEGVNVVELLPRNRGRWEDLVPSRSDVLHLWGTPAQAPKKAFVVTIQGNGRPGERFHPNTIFISARHASRHGGKHYVYNGIDLEDYPCDLERDDSLVFLAKASWKVKNLAGAIEIARAARKPLYVLGSRDWPFGLQRYLPAWRGVRYRGMVDDIEKRRILRKALALLFPVRWHEPFGIAITEALASGCAVFGTPYGSLPEIVTEKTGVLSHEADILLNAVLTRRFSPRDCRARVSEGFSHLQMAEAYLKLYEKVLRSGRLHDGTEPARARSDDPAEKLLPWRSLERTRKS